MSHLPTAPVIRPVEAHCRDRPGHPLPQHRRRRGGARRRPQAGPRFDRPCRRILKPCRHRRSGRRCTSARDRSCENGGCRRSGHAGSPARLHRRRRPGAASTDRPRSDRSRRMNVLVAVTWDPRPWIERFRRPLPDRKTVLPGEPFDRRGVRYVATWGPKPGSLSGLPNLQVIFSWGPGWITSWLTPIARRADRARRAGRPDRAHERVRRPALPHASARPAPLRRSAARPGLARRPASAQSERGSCRVDGLRRARPGRSPQAGQWASTSRGWSRGAKRVDGFSVFAGHDLDAFLARTDILVSLLPLTPKTRGILNRALFQKLPRRCPRGPVLINAGRGGLQVEADLLACLDDGTLKAATLDVFETEPLPDDSALWSHPRDGHAAQRGRQRAGSDGPLHRRSDPPLRARRTAAEHRRSRKGAINRIR